MKILLTRSAPYLALLLASGTVFGQGAIKAIDVCPGQTIALSNHTSILKRSKVRLCLKMVNTFDGKPTSAEFWNITLLGQIDKRGTHTGSACFDFTADLVGRHDLKVGAFQTNTTLFIADLDMTRISSNESHEVTLSSIAVPPESSFSRPKIDPCRPLCEQTPAPALNEIQMKDRCRAFCPPSGNWRITCPDPEAFDAKTGKRKPHVN